MSDRRSSTRPGGSGVSRCTTTSTPKTVVASCNQHSPRRGFGRVKVLLHLEEGPMTLRDIADANGLDAPYATVICDKLVEKGLVTRTPHPTTSDANSFLLLKR